MEYTERERGCERYTSVVCVEQCFCVSGFTVTRTKWPYGYGINVLSYRFPKLARAVG